MREGDEMGGSAERQQDPEREGYRKSKVHISDSTIVLMRLLCYWILVFPVSAQSCTLEDTIVQRCCELRSGPPEELWDCVKRETKNYSDALLSGCGGDTRDDGASPNVATSIDMVVATYATDNIAGYAAYAMAVVAAWAEQQGYPMRIYTEQDGEALGFDTYDPRWNKVPTLRDALTRWAPQARSALWVDADLTVLDFSTTLEDFLSAPPQGLNQANLYVCAEHAGSTTYTNTGSFLAINSEHTIDLLDLWWTIGDRKLFSDQESLDLVKQLLEQKGKAHELRVLPTSFFNTDPPAMTQLTPSDRAMHLMGSTTPYRAAVFGKALEEVCFAHQEGGSLAMQLGITKQFLLSTALSVHQIEYDNQLSTIHKFLMNPAGTTPLGEEHLFKLQTVAHPLTHALIHTGNFEKAENITFEVRDAFVQVIDLIKHMGGHISPELLQKKIAQSMKCLEKPRADEPLSIVFANITTDLDDLEAIVNPKQMAAVVKMRASVEQTIVHHLIDKGRWEQALERQFGIIKLLQRDDIMEHNQIKPRGTLASLLCQAERYDEALPHFQRVIELQTSHFGASHPTVALEHLNRGICLYEYGKYKDAKKDLAKAKQIYKINNYPSNSMELQKADHFHRVASAAAIEAEL